MTADPSIVLRAELATDLDPIRRVVTAAFERDDEARLVDRLRANGRASISLVAVAGDEIVGHCLFSPVRIVGDTVAHGLGLAPVAVTPSHQGQRIGSKLIERGMSEAERLGVPFVVVLGHADYYPRFGFELAKLRGISNEYGADDVFFVSELIDGGLPEGGGVARYGHEFAEVD